MLSPENFFNTNNHIFNGIFFECRYVWEGLRNITKYISENLKQNLGNIPENGYLVPENLSFDNGAVIQAGAFLFGKNIQIGKNTIVESGAYIKSPAIIGADTEVRHNAYLRGNIIIGDNCIIGHSTEIKNSVLLGKSKAGHFAYIGDSILGAVNLGAGTKLANLKLIDSKVSISINGEKYETGLKKFGAIFADGVETGCNSVAAPGTLLSKNVILYPNTTAKGYYNANTIIKLRQQIEKGEKTSG